MKEIGMRPWFLATLINCIDPLCGQYTVAPGPQLPQHLAHIKIGSYSNLSAKFDIEGQPTRSQAMSTLHLS